MPSPAFLILVLALGQTAVAQAPKLRAPLSHTKLLERIRAIGQRATDSDQQMTQWRRAARTPDAKSDWRKAWLRGANARRTARMQVGRIVHQWDCSLVLATAEAKRPAQAKRVLEVLAAWMQTGDPVHVREFVGARLPRCRATMAAASSKVRRQFLSSVVARAARIPTLSDLHVLTELCRWQEWFAAELEPGRRQCQQVTSDLILLLTDRAPDGLLPSARNYYEPGRFTSVGFREQLRDDSDQVRHFAWALRLYAVNRDFVHVDRLLKAKERLDATRRKLPVNKADLALNRAARGVAMAIIGDDDRAPLPVSDYAKLLLDRLGSQ